MLQPASVRTLLYMRSSFPTRPATVGNQSCVLQDQGSDGAVERRPFTAPAVAQAHPTGFLDKGYDDDDEENDSDEDPSLVLAHASSAINHLKNKWHDERRERLSLLWRQLETSYTRMPPTRILDEILDPMHGTEQEKGIAGFAGDAETLDGHAEISNAEVAAGPAVCAADKEAETAADALISSAANQLASCQHWRKALEGRLESCPSSPSARAAWPEQADVAGGNAMIRDCCDNEADRVRALRCEVDRLRITQSDVQIARSRNGDAPLMSMQMCPDSVHDALNQWIQDMTLLQEDDRGAPKISSPRRASHSKGTTPSRKAMAQIAEARAVKWATGQNGDMTRDDLPAHMHPATSFKGTCPSPGRSGGSASSPVADEWVSQIPCTVEQHLDDILHEFDEIDSIYGSIVKITQQ